MTKEEAFKNWRYNNPITYSSRPQLSEAWEAACEWQKEQDASLIYTKGDPRYHPYGEVYEEDVREACAEEIRST